MNLIVLRRAARLAEEVGHCFIATSNPAGWPHLAIAGRLGLIHEAHLTVTEWFCPGTMLNLQSNPRVAVVVWDPTTDAGYQLLGELESMRDTGIIDGYADDTSVESPLPQEERQLVIHVDRIIEFRRAPHADIEQ